jgi:putative ATP-dependent endonuclease of OLD family
MPQATMACVGGRDFVYLAELTISNFRKLRTVALTFKPGLNIVVGPNNVGKTAVIDSLRALLAGHDEPFPKLSLDDVHRAKNGQATGPIEFHYIFSALDQDDEADFLSALIPSPTGELQAHIHIRYSDPDASSGRLRIKRWCGQHEENSLSSEMMENLRGVYLPPLRDASLGLRPSRSSQLARLLHILADESGRLGINEALKALDTELKAHPPMVDTQAAITGHHNSMLGGQLSQALEVGLSVSDFQRLSSRLSLMVDSFEIEQNGLGFNNLIFMAVVLSELAKNPEASYRGLIVEEPEAHLHPQLQAVLLKYLQNIRTEKRPQLAEDGGTAEANEQKQSVDRPLQVFVTSHSPNFASIAKLESLICLIETNEGATSFFPHSIIFGDGKLEKLERYLDVTRAELFFARRVIFVEGAAELMLVSVLAEKCGHNLRDHGVSLISVEGLNFDCFLPLFGENSIRIPVSIITDADPSIEVGDAIQPVYPSLGETVSVSDNTASMLTLKDSLVGVFHGLKTLEYDLALFEDNRTAMLNTLKRLHPKIGVALEKAINDAPDNTSKARVLFSGMFERTSNNIQKGRFGQALSQTLMEKDVRCTVPQYIRDAIEHVCQVAKAQQ